MDGKQTIVANEISVTDIHIILQYSDVHLDFLGGDEASKYFLYLFIIRIVRIEKWPSADLQ